MSQPYARDAAELKRSGKSESLRQVRQAKAAHIRWRAHVHSLVAGLNMDGDACAPVHHKDCAFGQWFFNEAFKTFGHWRIYQDVDEIHELMHTVYSLLHQTLEAGESARAAAIADQLAGISDALLAVLDVLADEIRETEEF